VLRDVDMATGKTIREPRKACAYLHIFKTVLLTDTPQHILLTALLQFARQQELIEYEVCLLEVEDDVQLANIAIVFVHLLDIAVNDLERDQFIVGGVTTGDEEQRCIATVNDLGVCDRRKKRC
jgi:hypothetical protein